MYLEMDSLRLIFLLSAGDMRHEIYDFDKAIQHIGKWKKFKGPALG